MPRVRRALSQSREILNRRGKRVFSDSLRFRLACRLVPELKLARGYDEQQEVYERAKPLGIVVMPCVLVFLILTHVPTFIWNWQHGSFGRLDMLMLLNLALFAAMIPYQRRYSRKIARRYLQLRGVPICTRCACDLAGIDVHAAPHCPRCGDSIDPDSPEGVAQLAMKATSIRYRFFKFFMPELALARTDFERGLICYESKIGTPLYSMTFLLTIAATMLGFWWLPGGSRSTLPASESNSLLLTLLPLIPLAAAVIVGPIYIGIARRTARFKLHGRGVNLCLHCGHAE